MGGWMVDDSLSTNARPSYLTHPPTHPSCAFTLALAFFPFT